MEVQKTSNKENARPKRAEQKQVVTSFIKRPAPGKSAPLRSKNDPKDGAVEKRAEPLKKATEQQKSSVAKPPLASKKPASLSQKFLSQQSSTYKKMQTQTPKPASVAPPKAVSSVAPKPTLGTYKGKVIQSKVDCFRKPEDPATKAAEKRVFARPAVPKYTPLTPATLSRIKSRSVTTLASAKPASSTVSQTQPRRPKSVTDVPLSRPASRTTTTRGQPQTVSTTRQFQVTKRPPVTTTNRPVAPAMAGTKGVAAATTRLAKSKSTTELNQRAAKPPAPAPSSTLRPPPRKPAVSTLSHTRATMETAEERRAKLAEWLATKGKTLKRPPIHASSTTTTTQPPAQRSKPAATKPRAAASTAPAQKKAQPATAPEVTHQAPEPEPVVELTAPQPQSWEEQEEEEAAGSSGPVTSSPSPAAAAPAPGMNTTLDMLDSCALDLPEVDVEVEVPMHE
ncbi:proteoglycan 4, partial [Engraulis encrasicolus]|uniref:proteoglycan 4 n=1 Tax=Engraulis encrasicolus TaxID=184585 RepID=UPI002FD2D3B0